MRRLTRDVATSPLRRPPLRDTGTCTDGASHVPRAGHAAATRAATCGEQGSPPAGTLSPLGSGDSPESRTGNEDYIDDEIGDQPAFGAYGSESMSPGAFLEDVLSAGLSEPTSPPLPPLQITESLRDDYVRPFRLTPRPINSLTTLETPLRRWAAESETTASASRRQVAGGAAEVGTTASERRRQMEERAEQLARRLGVGESTPLGSTYQRLGLPDPLTPESNGEAGPTLTLTTAARPPTKPGACPITADTPHSSLPASPKDLSTTPSSITASPVVTAATAPAELLKATPSEPTASDSADQATSQPAAKISAKATAQSPGSASAKAPAPAEDVATDPPHAAAAVSTSAPPAASASFTSSTPPREAPSAAAPTTSPASAPAPERPAAVGAEVQTPTLPARPRRPSEELGGREEDSLSDLESRDEVLAGCRPRRYSWRRVSELREVTSPTDSLNSDDLMADFDKDSDDAVEDDDSLTGQVSRLQRMRLRASSCTDTGRPSPDPAPKLLRPPRQNSAQDASDWLLIDRDTYMYMAQDFTHTKTMLHKLRRLLQDAETTNPFENSIQAGRRAASVSGESQVSPTDGSRDSVDGGASLAAENADLRRQVAALQLQVADQSRTIRLLQQQMGSSAVCPPGVSSVATQASQVVTEDPNVITVAPERG